MTEDELKLEISILLYQQGKISSGKVRAWTRINTVQNREIYLLRLAVLEQGEQGMQGEKKKLN